MSKQQPPENKALLPEVIPALVTFFETALNVIKPSFMKLLVVFAVVVLLALLIVNETNSPVLAFALVVVVVLIFAFLAFALQLQYTEIRFRYPISRSFLNP